MRTPQTKYCKRCGRDFEFSEADAGKWEDYCHRCEKILEKQEQDEFPKMPQ